MSTVCGRYGLSIDDFWRLETWEIVSIIQGKKERLDDEMQSAWEQARLMGYFSVVPHQGKNGKIRKVTDLMTFPWEQEAPEVTKQMKEAAQEVWKKMDAIPFKGFK